MANTKRPELQSSVMLPMKSIDVKAFQDSIWQVFSGGQKFVIASMATNPKGILVVLVAIPKGDMGTYFMLKSHRQSENCTTTPPTMGPNTNAMVKVAPIMAPIKLGLCDGPTSTKPIWVRLYSPDAPMPWNPRQTILDSSC